MVYITFGPIKTTLMSVTFEFSPGVTNCNYRLNKLSFRIKLENVIKAYHVLRNLTGKRSGIIFDSTELHTINAATVAKILWL